MIRILVVEDNPNKSNTVLSIGLENGIDRDNIVIKENLSEAIEQLKINTFTLLVLDLNLPVRKKSRTKTDAGVQLLKMLTTGELNVPKSVIGVTSHSDLTEKYSDYFKSLDFNLFHSDTSDAWELAIENKIKWFKNELSSRNKKPSAKVIVTVHGIRTAGKWQKELENAIFTENKEVHLEHYEFKNISSFKLLNPFSRRNIAINFLGQLKELIKENPTSEFYFFSHSFGTYLLSRALENLTPENTPKIKCVVLAGSVLKRTYQWHKIKSNLSIDFIINDCGIDDKVLLLSELFAVGLGMAGRVGFDSFKSVNVINRQHIGGHSFFEKNKDFYKIYWLPLLVESNVPEAIIIEQNSTLESLLDSLKYILWGSSFILLLILILINI